MEITTSPVCKIGWEGQTLRYVVKAEGATEIAIGEFCIDGVEARITDTRQVPGGIEADLVVQVTDSELY
jgi:hypothetical protein